MLMLNESREQMMPILDSDLANVIQAERQREAADQRSARNLVAAPLDRAPTFNASRLSSMWLRAWMVRRLPVLGTR